VTTSPFKFKKKERRTKKERNDNAQDRVSGRTDIAFPDLRATGLVGLLALWVSQSFLKISSTFVLAHRVLLRLSLLLPYSPPRNPSRAVRLLIQCCVPILHRAPSVAAPRSFLVVPTLARSVLRPRCYAPCLVPRPHRGAAGVLPTSPFTT
jgi:hypothetical protein